MLFPNMKGLLLLALSVVMAECCYAQIKIIPRHKVDSINNVSSLAHSPIQFVGGDYISFDTIAEHHSPWQRVIEWQNVGDKPIVINEIKSSCGCLRVQSDSRVVRSGDKSSLTIKYYPKGHAGRVSQRLFFFTSVDERRPTAVLHVSGYVEASTDRGTDYPYSRGKLLLRQDAVVLDGSGVYRMACYNAEDKALRLSADTLLSTHSVKMRTEPAEIQPRHEGDLVITCDEKSIEGDARLYIKGLQLPPRERVILLRKE